MPVPLIVDSLDDIGESDKALYKETDGKFHLDPDLYRTPKEKAVDAKNKDLLGKLNKLKPIADKFKDVDDDTWNLFQEFKAKKDEGADDDPDPKSKDNGKGNVDELQQKWQKDRERSEAKLKAAHKAEVEALKAQLVDANNRHQQFAAGTLMTEIALKAGVLPERMTPFKKTYGDRFKISEHNELIVLDDEGEPMDVTPAKFIADNIREEYPFFFKAAEQGGSGANGGGNGNKGKKTIKRADFERLSPLARDAKIKEGFALVE